MAATAFNFKVVSELPSLATADPNALYIFKESNKNYAKFFKANVEKTAFIPFVDFDLIKSDIFSFGTTQPVADSNAVLWYNPTSKELRFKTDATTWTLFEVDVVPPVWTSDSVIPPNSVGVRGDMHYDPSNGTLWRKGNSAWVQTPVTFLVETPEKKLVRIIDSAGVVALADVEGVEDELLLVQGLGLFIHKNAATDAVNGSTVLASGNGRWIMECVGLTTVRNTIENTFTTLQGSSTALNVALNGIIMESVSDVVYSGQLINTSTTTIAPNTTFAFYLNIEGVELGDVVFVSPRQYLDFSIDIKSTISAQNEVRVEIFNPSTTDPIELDVYWNYTVIKRQDY